MALFPQSFIDDIKLHANIVQVFDFDEVDELFYIAMEFVEGRSLRSMLDAHDALPVPVIADIVAQVADALDHARGLGIVHRDIKPANIMLTPDRKSTRLNSSH